MEHVKTITSNLINIMESSLHVHTKDDLINFFDLELRRIFQYSMACGGVGHIESGRIINYINMGFPNNWESKVIHKNNTFICPFATAWSQSRIPFRINKIGASNQIHSDWRVLALENNIHNLIAHGQIDIDGKLTSYVSFSNIDFNWSNTHIDLLSIIIPHLHTAIARSLSSSAKPRSVKNLSKREIEILQGVYSGKSNCSIGASLFISEYTVKNHISRILRKMCVSNRAQAIAMAVEYGIFD